ncbi:polysaccharide deacetylase family protein [Micromonospora sp. CPCC 206061]|uniref:polysaccharide deacetylase family protein n=1 Tax=Micromonospora sp. CPCC 206061 TaxID=3122410 RepID=UPI002FF03993
MTRRGAFTAALLVLAILVGGRWAMGRQPAETVAHQALGSRPVPAESSPAPTPTAAATPSVAPPTTKAPAPKKTTTKPAIRSKVGPFGTRRMTGSRGVALTFDDGPNPAWTPAVLDLLRANRVKATFCVVGTEVRHYPALVKRIVREGHTLCNHSWHHEFDLGTKPEQEIKANMLATNREIQRAVPGARVKYFRHPGGKWTAEAVKAARELGMTSLDWDVDPTDWAKPSAEAIKQRVMAKARSGSIILLHDGGGDRAGTVAACKTLIPALKRKYGIVLLR